MPITPSDIKNWRSTNDDSTWVLLAMFGGVILATLIVLICVKCNDSCRNNTARPQDSLSDEESSQYQDLTPHRP